MYSIDLNYFKNIDSEEKAYVLAWFWSRVNGRVFVSNQDSDVLFLIKKSIKYTGEIYQYNNIAELNLSNTDFIKELELVGCKNRTHFQLFPIISIFLIKHFLRGIFDSYGTINIVKNKYLNVNIIYDENFVDQLRQFLFDNLYIPTKHYYRYSHTNTIQMMITKTIDAKKFLNWLYQDANYYLTRKFQKYQEYVENGV